MEGADGPENTESSPQFWRPPWQVFVAAVAVTISGAAFAKDLKGSVMIDSEMLGTATGQVSNATDALNNASDLAGRRVGWGLSTAGTPASVLHPPELIEAARRTD